MSKKKLIQRLQQLIDTLPLGGKRKSVKKDLLELKLSKNDYHYVSMANKYKENL